MVPTRHMRFGCIWRKETCYTIRAWLNAPDEVAEVGEDPVFEQAAGGSLALDSGGGDHRGVAREQLATPDNSHEKSKR